MSDAAAAYEVRGALALQGRVAYGWCQSPQRPAEALQVEILADHRLVASFAAGRLHFPLVRPGVTDGYHGFSVALPEAVLVDTLLEARERKTGQVFARLLPSNPVDIGRWQEAVTAVGHNVERLRARFPDVNLQQHMMRAAFGEVGRFLAPDASELLGGARRTSRLALRTIVNPAWSIIVDLPRSMPVNLAYQEARAWTLDIVAGFAPLLGIAQAELIVIDDGRAAPTLTAITGLRYCLASEPQAAIRLNRAITMARGVRFACFAPIAKPSLRRRAHLLSETGPETILLGGGAAHAIRGAGLPALAEKIITAMEASGLLLLAPRLTFNRRGPLNGDYEDRADLPLVAWAWAMAGDTVDISVLEEPLAQESRVMAAEETLRAARRAFLAALESSS